MIEAQAHLEADRCPTCGAYMDWVICWNGCAEGWVPAADDPDELEECRICSGVGGWFACRQCEPEYFG